MATRINNVFGKNILYDKVNEIKFSENEFKIIESGGKIRTLDFKNIDERSKLQLKGILKANIPVARCNGKEIL